MQGGEFAHSSVVTIEIMATVTPWQVLIDVCEGEDGGMTGLSKRIKSPAGQRQTNETLSSPQREGLNLHEAKNKVMSHNIYCNTT